MGDRCSLRLFGSGTSVRRLALLAVFVLMASACGALPGDEASDVSTVVGDVSGPASPDADNAADGDTAGSTVVTEPTETTETTEPEPVEMPDLVGKTEAEARSELNSLGFGDLTVTAKASFEPAGTVLEQIPTSGRVVSGTVSLVVAESVPPMPDFVGLPIAQVRSWAAPLEIDIREESELTTETVAGTVLEQVPAAGAQVSQEVIITVAESPTIVALADFQSVNSKCYAIDDIGMSGSLFPQTPVFNTRCSIPFAEFNLSRDYSSLRFTAGIDDTLAADGAMQLEITADGQTIYSETITFGETKDVELDVTDVLRLQITSSKVSGKSTRVGLGNAELLGGASSPEE